MTESRDQNGFSSTIVVPSQCYVTKQSFFSYTFAPCMPNKYYLTVGGRPKSILKSPIPCSNLSGYYLIVLLILEPITNIFVLHSGISELFDEADRRIASESVANVPTSSISTVSALIGKFSFWVSFCYGVRHSSTVHLYYQYTF